MPSDPVDAPPAAACGRAARAWALRARLYDVLEASDRRRASAKRTLFQQMQGETLFVGIGTGLDIAHFPHGPAITAIDISPAMLARAQPRQRRYVAAIAPDGAGILRLEQWQGSAPTTGVWARSTPRPRGCTSDSGAGGPTATAPQPAAVVRRSRPWRSRARRRGERRRV